MKRKLLYLDLETTGTKVWMHGVHQIAGEIVIDGQLETTFDIRPRPFDTDAIDPDALETSGVTEEELWSRDLTPESAHHELLGIFDTFVERFDNADKFTMVGFNIYFDNEFLRKWWSKCGDDFFPSWVRFPLDDVAQTAARVLGPERRAQMESFRLEKVLEEFGIRAEGEFHDAAVDIRATRLLHEKVNKRVRVLPNARSVVGEIGDAIRFYREDAAPEKQNVGALAKWLVGSSGGFIDNEQAMILADLEYRQQ